MIRPLSFLLIPALLTGVLLSGCGGGAPAGVAGKGAPSDAKGRPVPYTRRPVIAQEGMADSLRNASPRLTDIARLLAGYPVEASSEMAGVMNTDAWKSHENAFKQLWNEVDTAHLEKIRLWASKEVDPLACSERPVFYPFSGPDFLFANTMYPKSNLYVMGGLEPVGEVPDLKAFSNEQLASSFRGLQNSLNDILIWSFFRTIDMNVDLKQNQLKGVIPVFMVFLAKTNHEILDIRKVGIDKSGDIVPYEKAGGVTLMELGDAPLIPGLQIVFRKRGEDQVKQIYYFSVNLSNYVAMHLPEYGAFVQKMRYPSGYLKGASYLMHNDYFDIIRNLMLDECTCVLEDDSGIPVRFFQNDKWDNKFYGAYTTPIGLFANRYQPDLREIYVNGKDVYPIDFGIGYRFRKGESNMLLSVDKAYETKLHGKVPEHAPTTSAAPPAQVPEAVKMPVKNLQEPPPDVKPVGSAPEKNHE